MSSATTRTLERCRKLDWMAGVVEKWIPIPGHPIGGVRRDLYGFIDVVACTPEGVRFMQITTGTNLAARITKATTECREQAIHLCETTGAIVEFWGWRKLQGRGARKWWAKRVRLYCRDGLFRSVDLEDL